MEQSRTSTAPGRAAAEAVVAVGAGPSDQDECEYEDRAAHHDGEEEVGAPVWLARPGPARSARATTALKGQLTPLQHCEGKCGSRSEQVQHYGAQHGADHIADDRVDRVKLRLCCTGGSVGVYAAA